MFCGNCGNKLKDGVRFCGKCGNKVGTIVDDNRETQEYRALTNRRVNDSIAKIGKMSGYYCITCGNYIDTVTAVRYGEVTCKTCGCQIIAANYLAHGLNAFFDYGVAGGLLYSGIKHMNVKETAASQVKKYYMSEYYKQTKYPCEYVAADKGRMGEYLISVGLAKAKKKLPGRSLHAYYNLVIPEPNGSCQEIDAIIIYGKFIFVIEAKNRSGEFIFDSFSDIMWNQVFNDGTSKMIYSPFIQNEEHISSLRKYLDDKGIVCNFINSVVMGSCGSWNTSVVLNDYDSVNFGLCLIANNIVFEEYFIEVLKSIEALVEDLDYERKEGKLSDKAAAEVVESLIERITMTDQEKADLLEQRELNSGKYRKNKREYYYIDARLANYLVRTNGVYAEIYAPSTEVNMWMWMEATNSCIELRKGIPKCWNIDIEQSVALLEDKSEIVKARNCIRNGEQYDYKSVRPLTIFEFYPDQEHYNKFEYRGTGQSQSYDNEAETEEQRYDIFPANMEVVYFSGCEDIDMLDSRYHILCKAFHSDGKSGDEESFKRMKAEYDAIKKKYER